MTPFRRFVLCAGCVLLGSFGCRSTGSAITTVSRPVHSASIAETSAAASLKRPAISPQASLERSDEPIIRPASFDENAEADSSTAVPEPAPLPPETLSLPWLVEEVQRVNPSVQAMYAAWQSASDRYPQVISLEDPMFGATFAPASFDSRDVESAYALEASQKFPWHGKRRLRGDAARWEAGSAGWDVATTRQKLAEAAELAYWDYYGARRQLELNEQNVTILQSFRDNADNRYRTGLVTQQDVLQANIELANLEQRHIELERMNKVAAGRINVLIRRNPIDPLPPPAKSIANDSQLPDQGLLLTEAVSRRPDISAAASRVQAEQAKWSLACKEYYPDVELFGRYDKFWQPTGTQGDLQWQAGLRINVPIYHGRLNAAVAEAMHQFSKARAEYDQLVLDVQADVQAGYEQVRESERIIALYSETLIPAAEQNASVARANYDVSKINFLDLAIAQRQLVEARDRKIQAQVELQRRTATLRRAVGGSLPSLPPAPAVTVPAS